MTIKQQAAKERAAELQEQLVQRIEALTTSDDWKAMLDTAAAFHNYSFSNVMLIRWQKPDARRVAGFKTWQSLGRMVNKGEKAIRILAPLLVNKKSEDEDGEEKTRKVLVGFRSVPVFDISQTSGKEIPEVLPTRLTGDSLGIALQAAQAITSMLDYRGFTVVFDGKDWPESQNGETNYATHTVTIRDGLEPDQVVKTLAHELAHAVLHEPREAGQHRGVAEVEAESVAYVLCKALGIETGSYSLPYVALWAQGDVDKIRSTGTTVVKTAHELLADIEELAAVAA